MPENIIPEQASFSGKNAIPFSNPGEGRGFKSVLVFLLVICFFPASPIYSAKVSPEARKELASIKKELGYLARTIRNREYTEARTQLKEINSSLDQLIQKEGLDENYSLIKNLKKTIERREEEILKRDPSGGPVLEKKSEMKDSIFSDEDGDKKTMKNESGKVSFTRDIAPFMVNLCLRCHNNKKTESGFSLQTFEMMMKGGENGAAITPGNLDESYLWSLVGEQDPIKMPQGQARITRKNWTDLKEWIEKGAKFDGGSVKTNLAELVPSKKAIEEKKMRAMSNEEFQKLRMDKSLAAWKRFHPNQQPNVIETEELYLLGNVEKNRLEEYVALLEEGISVTRETFHLKEKPLFRGRLAVFILKDRFTFDEYHLTVEKKEVPPDITFSSQLSSTHEDARMVFLDTNPSDGDNSSPLSFPLWVTSRVPETYLSEEGSKLPYWIKKGTGLAALISNKRYNKELRLLGTQTIGILRNKTPEPGKLFDAATFLNSEMYPVSMSLVYFFIQSQGQERYLTLIKEIHSGTSQVAALRKVYGQPPNILGQLFYQKLR